jgi:hypothetical protein
MSYSREVHLAGEVLDRAWPVCAFFNNREESYRILLPFIKEGFEQGNRAAHILGPGEREEHVRCLEQADINVAEAEQRNQLVIRSWDNTYLRDGYFDVDRQIALIEELLADGKARGFELTRLIARMEWALQDLPAVSQFVEYEVHLNQALQQKYDGVVCWTYDLSKFSASMIMDVLRTHPVVLIGEVLHRNAFFVSPEELLRELRDRPNPDNAGAGEESGQ